MKKRLVFITLLAALLIGAGISVSAFVMHWRALPIVEEIGGYEIGQNFPLRVGALSQEQTLELNAQLREQCPELTSYWVMDSQLKAPKVLVVHPNSMAISKTYRHRINETVWAWLAQQSILQDRAAQAEASAAQASQERLEQLQGEIAQLKAENEALQSQLAKQKSAPAADPASSDGEAPLGD